MIKKKILGLAVAAALSVGVVAQSAQAANIATNGVGEVIFVPYYSTEDGRESYVRLVNNGFDTLIVKLKLREGKDSQDVRDFHIFLSPRDVWTAKIYDDGAGGVRLVTFDTSCTVPDKGIKLISNSTNDNGQWRKEENGGWSINVPAGDNGFNPKEGYIVAQVMGTSESGDPSKGRFDPFTGKEVGNESVASLAKHVTHNPGTDNEHVAPRDCGALSVPFALTTSAGTDGLPTLENPDILMGLKSQFTEPTNTLSAAAAILDTKKATLSDIPVTVLANVFNPGPDGVDGASGYLDAGLKSFENDNIDSVGLDSPNITTKPTLVAHIFDDKSAKVTEFETSIPVAAALMHSSVMNNLDTTGANSWVVTFPTKRFHLVANGCTAPFPQSCSPKITSIQHTVHNKGNLSYVTNEEESEFFTPSQNQLCFSGPDFEDNCGVTTNSADITLDNEVNIISMGDNGNPLPSSLEKNIPKTFLGDIVYGWMQMRFNDATPITDTSNTIELFGLPAIGFAYTEYNLGGITTMTQEHTYTSPLSK